jgi:hypothetical protein
MSRDVWRQFCRQSAILAYCYSDTRHWPTRRFSVSSIRCSSSRETHHAPAYVERLATCGSDRAGCARVTVLWPLLARRIKHACLKAVVA